MLVFLIGKDFCGRERVRLVGESRFGRRFDVVYRTRLRHISIKVEDKRETRSIAIEVFSLIIFSNGIFHRSYTAGAAENRLDLKGDMSESIHLAHDY